MFEDEAKKLLETLLGGRTITKIDDYGDVFVVYSQDDEYVKTKNLNGFIIGEGPIIIEKVTKIMTRLGSGSDIIQCIEAFRACGDFFALLGRSILVSGNIRGVDKLKTILKIKDICGCSVLDSKNAVHSIQSGRSVEFSFNTPYAASVAVVKLTGLGLTVSQKWEP